MIIALARDEYCPGFYRFCTSSSILKTGFGIATRFAGLGARERKEWIDFQDTPISYVGHICLILIALLGFESAEPSQSNRFCCLVHLLFWSPFWSAETASLFGLKVEDI
jgi:hypothetical protein